MSLHSNLILPKSSQPILGGTQIDPGSTASTRALERALTTYYGYSKKKGGKGSHVKLVKPDWPNIHLPGERSTLSPGVIKNILRIFGGHPISSLPQLLAGNLTVRPK